MKAPVPTETQECEVFHQWLELKGIKHHHIASESQSGRRDAVIRNARNKRMGQSRGFLDYILILPTKYTWKMHQWGMKDLPEDGNLTYAPSECTDFMKDARFLNRVVAIEMKRRGKSVVSPEQKAWIQALNDAGVEAVVCRGCAEAIDFVERNI